jgi:hypothetical protein
MELRENENLQMKVEKNYQYFTYLVQYKFIKYLLFVSRSSRYQCSNKLNNIS